MQPLDLVAELASARAELARYRVTHRAWCRSAKKILAQPAETDAQLNARDAWAEVLLTEIATTEE